MLFFIEVRSVPEALSHVARNLFNTPCFTCQPPPSPYRGLEVSV